MATRSRPWCEDGDTTSMSRANAAVGTMALLLDVVTVRCVNTGVRTLCVSARRRAGGVPGECGPGDVVTAMVTRPGHPRLSRIAHAERLRTECGSRPSRTSCTVPGRQRPCAVWYSGDGVQLSA